MNRIRTNGRLGRFSPDRGSGSGRGGRGSRRRADGGGAGGGRKKRGWFARHKIFTAVAAVVLIALSAAVIYGLYVINNPYEILSRNRTSPPTLQGTDAPGDMTTGATGGTLPADTLDPDPTPPDVVMPDTINILVLGTDASAQRLAEGGHATLTDCIIVVSINVKTKKASMVSIPRDTYVRIYNDKNKQTGAKNRINAAFGFGGGVRNESRAMLYAQNTINQFLAKGKIPIDYYVLFNMDFVCNLIDAVGGVDVPVDNLTSDTVTVSNYRGSFTYKNNTTMHMNGAMALTYARDRHHTKLSDQGRVTHQQDVIISLLKSLQDKGNILKSIPQLFSEFQKDIFTNLKSMDEILALAFVAKDIKLEDIDQYVVKGTGINVDNASMLVADQKAKADIVLKVFGIPNTLDSAWTYAKLQGEITAKLNAAKNALSNAKDYLAAAEGYYTDDEAADLRTAISQLQAAIDANDSDEREAAQEVVQTEYDQFHDLVQPRIDAVNNGKAKINWAQGKLNALAGYISSGDRDLINGLIATVQGYIDAKDYGNLAAAAGELESKATPIFTAAETAKTPAATVTP